MNTSIEQSRRKPSWLLREITWPKNPSEPKKYIIEKIAINFIHAFLRKCLYDKSNFDRFGFFTLIYTCLFRYWSFLPPDEIFRNFGALESVARHS